MHCDLAVLSMLAEALEEHEIALARGLPDGPTVGGVQGGDHHHYPRNLMKYELKLTF